MSIDYDETTGEVKSTLLRQTIEELATAAITSELAARFADLDPLTIINRQQDAVNAKAEFLGLLRLMPEDRAAVANLIDKATATIYVDFA